MAITFAHWKSAVSGSFNVASNWSTGVVPGASVQADLDASGAAYTVTSAANNTVDYLSIQSNATLGITSGVFTVYSAVNTYSDGDNDGTITIGAGASMTFGRANSPSTSSSELRNTGLVQISSTGAQASLIFAAPYEQFLGGGAVTLSGAASILGGASPVYFDNRDNTISGSGRIGNATLTLENDTNAVINANAAALLTIATGTNAITNLGTIETTGTGGLLIASSIYDNGSLLAAGRGALTLQNATVGGAGLLATTSANAVIRLYNAGTDFGGAVSTVAGSSILSLTGTTNALDGGDVENAGNIIVQNGSVLRLSVYAENTGTIMVGGTTSKTTLQMFDGGSSILGTGRLVLSNSANNAIVSDGMLEYFTNRSTVVGAGTIGDANLQFVNAAGGTVIANGSVALTIVGDSASGADPTLNAGLMEAIGAGGLILNGTMNNDGTIAAVGSGAVAFNAATISGPGLVEATQAGASITLNKASLTAGTLVLAAGTSLTALAGTTDTIAMGVVNRGTLHVGNGAQLVAGKGHWSNAGVISLDGTSAATTLKVGTASGAKLTLTGHGFVELTNGATSSIISNGVAATFQNDDNTIEGAGKIGDANLTINNYGGGVINADLAGGMTLDSGANTIVNVGTIESSTASGVTLNSAVFNPGRLVANAGTILAKADISGGGVALINNTAAVEFQAATSLDVFFGTGAAGTLRLDDSATDAYFGEIHGFTGRDKIDLSDIAYVAPGTAGATTLSYNGGSTFGNLTITQGTQTTRLSFVGNYAQSSFALQSDQHGGTLLT